MTAEAALELVPSAASRRPSTAQLLLVGVAYLVVVVAAAGYPLTSPLLDPSIVTPESQLTGVVHGAVWLIVLIVAMIMQVPEPNVVPVTLVDVDGATVAIEVWDSDPATFDRWRTRADEIVASFRFLRTPTSSP
jgi:hypothetical protein